ncbi:MAG: sortase [Actinomycetota bacterium]
MRIVRRIGNVFIVLGLTLLLFVAYEEIGTSIITNHHQSALAQEFDQELQRPSVQPTTSGGPTPSPSARAVHYSGPAPLFRLTIPRLGANWSRIVVEGVSLYALAYGPGHYPTTRLPGQKGTVGIACHRTGWGSPCIDINQMRPGDLIYIDTKAGRFVYKVTGLKQVEKNDGWVLNGDPNSKDPYRLAITTCTPPHTSLHRLVIWADQVTPVPGQKPSPVTK